MSADFWAGYVSGAIGILVGNPLDIIKTKLQAGSAMKTPQLPFAPNSSARQPLQSWTSFARGSAAPILGYGALNAILFLTYNRSIFLLQTGSLSAAPRDLPAHPPSWLIWTAGAIGGVATFFVSTPTELVKCRAQVANPTKSSWRVTQELWNAAGVRGLYIGGSVTAVRDAVGYGFYFWSYELAKRNWIDEEHDPPSQQAFKVLMCGGLAGVVTWASIFPLDAVKTRVQTWDLVHRTDSALREPLLAGQEALATKRPSTWAITSAVYQAEGLPVFFRGLGICSVRAFITNAVQWAVYEWVMKLLTVPAQIDEKDRP